MIDSRAALAARIARTQVRRMDRRDVLRRMGGLGLAVAGAATLGRSARAHQDGTPPATPTLGERPDGTRVWRVIVGGMAMEELLEAQAFFPGEITINAGDTIFFDFGQMPGFHTVTFPAVGEEPPAFQMPDPAATPAAAGEPPTLVYNPEAAFPVGGETYDGTALVNSGVVFFREGAPFSVTFPEPGEYEYLCIPHAAVMRARVIVQEAGSELPMEQADYDALAEEQLATILDAGRAAVEEYAGAGATPGADGATVHEVAVGVNGADGQAQVLRFLPEELEVKAGDTVRWVHRSAHEPHTVTFLGGEEAPEDVIFEPQPAGPPRLLQNNMTLFPQGGDVYNGEGFTNSGFMGDPLPGGTEYQLTFDTPGEYGYYCILHAGGPEDPIGQAMVGRITVTE